MRSSTRGISRPNPIPIKKATTNYVGLSMAPVAPRFDYGWRTGSNS